ncbi:hypothetical protein P3X46_011954 [Hevea brasiliensis]|uniref:Uncharacterized protein n=1 Tax=Hevea brasiliensis TaxID=3981 RepID=A0ABQ9MAK7_HEVBR|nr:hypothetical protein P3X46_011954 [Hevea brasiliensis]
MKKLAGQFHCARECKAPLWLAFWQPSSIGTTQAVPPACSVVAMATMGLSLASFWGNGSQIRDLPSHLLPHFVSTDEAWHNIGEHFEDKMKLIYYTEKNHQQ